MEILRAQNHRRDGNKKMTEQTKPYFLPLKSFQGKFSSRAKNAHATSREVLLNTPAKAEDSVMKVLRGTEGLGIEEFLNSSRPSPTQSKTSTAIEEPKAKTEEGQFGEDLSEVYQRWEGQFAGNTRTQ